MELQLKWTRYSILAMVGVDNTDANPNRIIFTIKNIKLYVHSVFLSGKYK